MSISSYRIFIFGSSGHLGGYLLDYLRYHGFNIYDFTKEEVASLISGNLKPVPNESSAIYINCAGIVGRKAETIISDNIYSDINTILPLRIVERCELNNSRLIHISTQSVFDGISGIVPFPTSEPFPLSRYGKSKSKAEYYIRSSPGASNHLILRTPLHYSLDLTNPRNLLTNLHIQIHSNKTILVSRREVFSVTSIYAICEVIRLAIKKSMSGILHVSESETWTWHKLSNYIKSISPRISLTYTPDYLNSPGCLIYSVLAPSPEISDTLLNQPTLRDRIKEIYL